MWLSLGGTAQARLSDLAFSASWFGLCPSGCSCVSVATLAFWIPYKQLLGNGLGRAGLPVCEAQALPRGRLAAQGGPACSAEGLERHPAFLESVLA